MDSWIVALRGSEETLVEARAVFGSPAAWLSPLELFACETADPATAARLIAQVAEQLEGVAGAVALEGDDPDGARARATALALAAGPGEVLFDRDAGARLSGELLFVRPKVREGWRLPVSAVALAPLVARRRDARDALAGLPAVPALVGREQAIAALQSLAASPGPVLLRAPPGWGGGRVITEAAARAGKTVDRVPHAALTDAVSLWKAMEALQGGDWLVVDPVTPEAGPLLARVAEKRPPSRTLVVRGDFETQLPFVAEARELVLEPLRGEEPRALVRALLGEGASEIVVRRLARRAGFVPRRVVEMVRGAVQLGELVRAPGGFRPRVRRTLGTLGSHGDPLAARVADLPPLLHRALAVLVAVGDGAREVEMLAAMRGSLSHAPDQLLAPLEAMRFVELAGDRVYLAASLRNYFPADDPRVIALARAGALEPGARAEALVRSERTREAAVPYARAATAALSLGLRAAAVRFAAAAMPAGGDGTGLPAEVLEAVRAVTAAISPAVTVEPLGGADATVRTRALDPLALEQAAAHFAERNDPEGEARMRALAELMRGNSQRALGITRRPGGDGTGKGQLVAALAQGAAGEIHAAIRTSLGALALARRHNESSGEAAALALLSSLYRAAGREDDARTLADGVKRLQRAASPQ
jgi:hypothetical protein